jgi:hypothetical protein
MRMPQMNLLMEVLAEFSVSGVRGAFDWRLIFELSGYAALR